jgi:hypothetical protein
MTKSGMTFHTAFLLDKDLNAANICCIEVFLFDIYAFSMIAFTAVLVSVAGNSS